MYEAKEFTTFSGILIVRNYVEPATNISELGESNEISDKIFHHQPQCSCKP